jgi:hypothetical protein
MATFARDRGAGGRGSRVESTGTGHDGAESSQAGPQGGGKMTVQPTTTPEALLTVFIARDWARGIVEQAEQTGLPKFHAGHALLAESVALLFGVSIEQARIFTIQMVGQVLDEATRLSGVVKFTTPEPRQADSDSTSSPPSNVIALRKQ